MPKYLVTGGCGFIGSHLVENLLNIGHSVRVIDDLTGGKKENVPAGIELYDGSITDPYLLEQALEGVNGVFHLAAIPSVQRSVTEWGFTHAINLSATISIFESISRREEKIPVIYASSAAVYGSCPHLPLKESERITPLTAYGVDKLGCELHAKVAWNMHHIPSIGFRIFNVYGPRQDPSSPYSGVISIFIKKCQQGDPLLIFGSGEQQRDFISVHDVVRYFIAAIDKKIAGANVYNLCRGIGASINELAEIIEALTKNEPKRDYQQARAGDVSVSIGDPTQAQEAFNMKATISLQEGLKELL